MKDARGGRKLGSATGDIVCWPPVLSTLHLKAIMTGKGRVGAGKEHEMEIYRRGGRGRGRGRGRRRRERYVP
jgi:hypothetical protein